MKTKQNRDTPQYKEVNCPDLLESMSDGVAIYEAVDNGQDFVFCEHNPAAEKITGFTKEQVLGRRVTEVFPGVETLGLLQVFKRVYQSGQRENHPISKYKDERVTLWVENSVFKLAEGRIVSVYRDISEQKRQQEQINHLSLLRKTGLTIHRHIATIKDLQELLRAICDVFVKEKGYRSAWIALLDENQKCQLTANSGLLKDFTLLTKEMKKGLLPPCIHKVMAEEQLLLLKSQVSLCEGCPLANGHPDAALMSAPLKHGTEFYGVITVSLNAEMVSNIEEQELFTEMARDIALALFNRLQESKREEHERELAIRDQISRTFIIHRDNNLYGGILEIVLAAMESKLGVFGYLDDPDMLICPSMTTSVWKNCRMPDKTIHFPRKKWAGFWKETLETGLTKYANTSFTVPKGHLAITNSMAAAIIYDNQVIGLLQVANREGDYTKKDAHLLENLAGTIAPILQARLEQQQAEEELQETLAEYADLYNNAPDMFVSVEAGSATILQCNQTLLATLGYTKDELIGHPVFKLYHPDCLDEAKNDIFPTFCRTGIINNRELLLQRKDGSSLPVTLDASAIRDTENQVVQSRSIFHDISERKKLEKQLLVSEKMTTIASLAAGVAHEINTPLSGILQASQLIKMGLDPEEKGNRALAAESGVDLVRLQDYLQQKELNFFLDGIKKSATTASHIVADLLQFSRPQESRQMESDLTELIDRSIELSRADYSLKKEFNIINVEFIRHYPHEPLQVNCLAMEIEQVIINLIKNACQAMAETNGSATPQIILRVEQRDKMAVIEVEDNGPGIAENIRAQIFDPFFTTKDVGEGTGLGLSVSYSIITDKHGGSIRVESAPNKGARFIIELPMEQIGEKSNG